MTAIRKYRELLHLTQREVAEKMNVTPHAVTQWETGVRNPRLNCLKKLADILHCSVDDLLESNDIKN